MVSRIPRVALKQTAGVSTMGLRWAPKCPPHLIDSKGIGIGCHYSTDQAEGESVLPLTKDSPDGFLLETVLVVGVERGKNE